PAANQPQHVPENVIVLIEDLCRNAQQPAELPVYLLVCAAGERKCERSRDSVVTLANVAVVPDVDSALRIGGLSQGGNRSCLQKVQARSFERPFDVLWRAAIL